MVSVTQRIKHIKQPRGGYIPPKLMHQQFFEDGKMLSEENISPALMGVMVDYLTRFKQTGDFEQAFDIPLKGMQLAKLSLPDLPMIAEAKKLIPLISDFSDKSIAAATAFTSYFDTLYRQGSSALKFLEPKIPDAATMENMRIMDDRATKFFTDESPIVKSELTFVGGYTETITQGDADFMSSDTLWDMKVSKKAPLNKYTLQLAVYYSMAKHSGDSDYQSLTTVGIFNPRLNIAYRLPMSKIDLAVIEAIDQEVIGY